MHEIDRIPEYLRTPEPGREHFWCHRCQLQIKREGLIHWDGDGMRHWLCPGCETDIAVLPSWDKLFDEYGDNQ